MRILNSSEIATIDVSSVPRHVAVIIDGNRRWASARGLAPHTSHAFTDAAMISTIIEARRLGIGFLTFYCLSSENLNRSADEVGELVNLAQWLWTPDLLASIRESGAMVRVAGAIDDARFSAADFDLVRSAGAADSDMVITFAVNYGSRQELAMAASRAEGDELDLGPHLYNGEHPDVDLVIRTSGESRLSNFMLWQSAYAELIFTDTLWPDFTGLHLASAVFEFGTRNRKMGL